MFDYTTRLGLLASAVILVLGGQVFLFCSVRFSLRTCCESCTREGIVWPTWRFHCIRIGIGNEPVEPE